MLDSTMQNWTPFKRKVLYHRGVIEKIAVYSARFFVLFGGTGRKAERRRLGFGAACPFQKIYQSCSTSLVKMLDELRPESRRNARGMILGVIAVPTASLAAHFPMFSGDMGDDLLQNTQRSLHEFRGPCSHFICVVQRSVHISPTATWSPRARESQISSCLVSDLKFLPFEMGLFTLRLCSRSSSMPTVPSSRECSVIRVEQHRSHYPLKSWPLSFTRTCCFGWGKTLSLLVAFTLQGNRATCVSTFW